MKSISRLFTQLIIGVILIYCLTFVTIDFGIGNRTSSSPSLSSLQCVRRKKQEKNKWSEGVHYPNQIFYEYIIAKPPEQHVVMAPKLNPKAKVVILVLSKNTEENVREEIRRTWGDKNNPYLKDKSAEMIFVVADNQEDLGCLIEENKRHEDILMVKVLDSYRGLVYKLLMAYLYISANYPDATMIKIDRDCIMEISSMMPWLQNQTKQGKDGIYGYVFFGAPPQRDSGSQWYVPESVFKPDWYPWYVNGNFYIISPTTLRAMINATGDVKVVEIEDLFFTGILRAAANLSKPIWLNEYKLPSPNYDLCPTNAQRRWFAHGGVGDKMTERYKNFLEWKKRDCNSTEAEIQEKEREKEAWRKKQEKKKQEDEEKKKGKSTTDPGDADEEVEKSSTEPTIISTKKSS